LGITITNRHKVLFIDLICVFREVSEEFLTTANGIYSLLSTSQIVSSQCDKFDNAILTKQLNLSSDVTVLPKERRIHSSKPLFTAIMEFF